MNIKDLPVGSYTPVQKTGVPLNIKNLPAGSYKPVSSSTDVLSGVRTPPKGIINTFKSSLEQHTQELMPSVEKAAAGKISETSLNIRALGAGAKTVEETAGAIPGAETAQKIGSKVVEQTIPQPIRDLAKNPAVKTAWEGIKGALGSTFSSWAEKHPEAATNLDSLLHIGTVAGTAMGAASVGREAVAGVKQITSEAGVGINAIKEANKLKALKNTENLFGTITQGKIGDIPKAKVALQGLDVTNVKSYKDLGDALNTKVETISSKLDEALLTDPTKHKTPDLSIKTKVGIKTVSTNYVDDGIKQLEDYYSKTGNYVKAEEMKQLRTKAKNEGLTVKEINDLAKTHGQEINAFNANGEAASGLTKQTAENTRSGIKTTARDLFGNEAYKAADVELSNTIKTRDLIKDVEEKVNTLKQRITQRGFGEKVGRLAFQVIDKVTGGGLKGFVQSFIPRSAGLKVMNALDLEKNLQKNLKAIQDILNANLPEQTIIQRLEEIQKSIINLKQLPAPRGGGN